MAQTYAVSAKKMQNILFAPDSVAEEVIQNVRTIITTVKGEIPLDRRFGISGDVVDLPVQVAQAKLTNEIFQAIKRYEPRAAIESVTFEADITGKLSPTVEVSINEA